MRTPLTCTRERHQVCVTAQSSSQEALEAGGSERLNAVDTVFNGNIPEGGRRRAGHRRMTVVAMRAVSGDRNLPIGVESSVKSDLDSEHHQ